MSTLASGRQRDVEHRLDPERMKQLDALIDEQVRKARHHRRALKAWVTWRNRHQGGRRALCRVCGRLQHAKLLCQRHYNQERWRKNRRD